jgi:branched-chain amino acid aminotransferase
MSNQTMNIKVTRTTNSQIESVDWENLQFGKIFADHMLVMDFENGVWQQPEIKPFGDLNLHPATSAIHYGQSIFEGMKANKMTDGRISIFRPNMNAHRLAESCERMCMPVIPEDLFLECVRQLVEVDKNWIPNDPEFSLYLRPFIFATDPYVGIRPSENYKFVVFTCPVGAYYTEPINVKIEEFYTRASTGGVGRAKTAGNYAASLYPMNLGKDEGFHQLLWTDGKNHEFIEESGTMNVMFVINDVLITPSEDEDTILRGVTKRSVVEIAESWGMKVEERKVTVLEIVEAARNGTLQDAFGAGTAATIAPILKIGYRDELLELAPLEGRAFSKKVYKYMNDLKLGNVEDTFGWNLIV